MVLVQFAAHLAGVEQHAGGDAQRTVIRVAIGDGRDHDMVERRLADHRGECCGNVVRAITERAVLEVEERDVTRLDAETAQGDQRLAPADGDDFPRS